MDRKKLETVIEREVYRFVSEVKEHMADYTMLFLNKNNVDMDREKASGLLDIAKGGIEDGLLSKMDFFKSKLEKALTEFTEQENPLARTKPSKKQTD